MAPEVEMKLLCTRHSTYRPSLYPQNDFSLSTCFASIPHSSCNFRARRIMQLPPLTVLLSWPTPNYADPTDHGPGLLIVNLVLTPLTISFVGLRLYTRIRISKSAGFDDVLIVLALVSSFFPGHEI